MPLHLYPHPKPLFLTIFRQIFKPPMKTIFVSLFILLISQLCTAQDEGSWDVYMAQYENGPGSVTLNMSLIENSPYKNLPYLVVTGVTFSNCSADGLPVDSEFAKLHKVSDAVLETITPLTKTEIVGSFTYQCERLDYLYVADTTNIRKKLTSLYASKFESYKPYINIKQDKQWEAYREFLYPNIETQEYMSNSKVIMQLVQAGDKLIKPRQVDHWLYFANEKDMKSFIKYSETEKFKTESAEKIDNSNLPYQLHISRVDKVDANSIFEVTINLRKKAKEHNGNYDGWETFIVKD